jgi:hypothetical protein
MIDLGSDREDFRAKKRGEVHENEDDEVPTKRTSGRIR